jgi:DNA repair protein RadD
MSLRKYQEHIVGKMLWAMTMPGNDIVCSAQGSGKSHIIAEFAHRLNQPVLILVPNKELLEQDLEKLQSAMPGEEIGVYSASMNSKEVKKVTIGTIQSVHKSPEKFEGFDVVIVDECDLVNPKDMDTTYRKLFIQAGIKKVFGMTATPYRQDHYYERWGKEKWMVKTITTTKMINRYKGFFWSRMLVVLNTKDLLDHDYLCPIEYHQAGMIEHSNIPTNKSQSDFDLDKFDSMIADKHAEIAWYITNLTMVHKAIIVYCATITQARILQSMMKDAVVVTAETPKRERETAVKSLKEGKLGVLLNVGIYTVGFDYPELDCIVLLRPTRSLRLHCQILGRVSRKAEGKTVGHVYDLVNNVKNMGELVDIRVVKSSIDGRWNVVSSARPGGFHMAPLYSFKLKAKQ